jgi:hypothetical protein
MPTYSIESLKRRIARAMLSSPLRILVITPGSFDEGPVTRHTPLGGASSVARIDGARADTLTARAIVGDSRQSESDQGLNFLTMSIARGPISPARDRYSFVAASFASFTKACRSSWDG